MTGVRARRPALLAGIVLLAAAALGGCDRGASEADRAPSAEATSATASAAEPDLYRVRSQSGRYEVQLRRADPDASYAAHHEWRVRVVDSEGRPIPPGPIAFDGGMPSHRHGFESRPLVSGRDADGWYRVEGVRFHMPGSWVLRVGFQGVEGMDGAELDLDVPY